MKKSTAAVLTVASLAVMTGLANAIPLTQPPGLSISEPHFSMRILLTC